MSSLWQSSKVFICFIFSVIISGDSVSYLLEIVVLISLESTLTQTRFGVRRLPSKGPMRCQYICFMAKSQSFHRFSLFFFSFFFQLIFLDTQPMFPLND